MELRSYLLAFALLAQAEAFSPGVAPLRAQRVAVSTNIRMAGWQDQYSGNAFKDEKKEKLKVASSSFDEMQKAEGDKMNKAVGIFGAATTVIILGLLFVVLQ